MVRVGTHTRSLVAGLAGLYYYAAASLYLAPDTLYIGHDGECIVESIKLLFAYAAHPLDLSVFGPLEGMGMGIQPIGVWLHPGCWPFRLFGDEFTAKLLSCWVAIVCISAATYGLGRMLNLPPLPSLISAQCAAILFFPPVASLLFMQLSLSHLYALWPFLGVTTALGTLFPLVLLTISGRTTRRRWMASAVLLPLIVLYSVLIEPLHTPVLFAPAGVVSCGVVLASEDRKTLGRRVLALVLCLIVFLGCNLVDYYRALSGFAARQAFPGEIGGEIQQFDRFVALLFQGPAAALLVMLLVAACLMVLRCGTHAQRGLAGSVLVILSGVVAASLYYLYAGVPWNRPPPSYFEHGSVPLYVLVFWLGAWIAARRAFASPAGSRLRDWFESRVGPRRTLLHLLAALVVPGVAGALLVWSQSDGETFTELPRPPGPILGHLAEQLAISPGDRFQGSVATLVGVPGGPVARQLGVPDDAPFSEQLINARTEYLRVAPHDLYQAALWNRRIPTLEQYNTLATTPSYFLFSRALARPHDYQMKNFVLVTRARPDLLACLGCRFLITDQQLDHPRLSLRVSEVNEFGVLFRLYELATPNLGQYSPVRLHRATDATDAIQRMLSQQFVFERDVVVFDSINAAGLVPAENVVMGFERGGVRVRGVSRGRSLLVLPLQFSHTLHVAPADSAAAATARLIRTNLAQTGVLFTGQLDIRISDRFGLLQNVQARLRDIRECERLGMVETGEIAYPQDFMPYRIE